MFTKQGSVFSLNIIVLALVSNSEVTVDFLSKPLTKKNMPLSHIVLWCTPVTVSVKKQVSRSRNHPHCFFLVHTIVGRGLRKLRQRDGSNVFFSAGIVRHAHCTLPRAPCLLWTIRHVAPVLRGKGSCSSHATQHPTSFMSFQQLRNRFNPVGSFFFLPVIASKDVDASAFGRPSENPARCSPAAGWGHGDN